MRGMVVGEGGRSSGVLLYHYIPVVNIIDTQYYIRLCGHSQGIFLYNCSSLLYTITIGPIVCDTFVKHGRCTNIIPTERLD